MRRAKWAREDWRSG